MWYVQKYSIHRAIIACDHQRRCMRWTFRWLSGLNLAVFGGGRGSNGKDCKLCTNTRWTNCRILSLALACMSAYLPRLNLVSRLCYPSYLLVDLLLYLSSLVPLSLYSSIILTHPFSSPFVHRSRSPSSCIKHDSPYALVSSLTSYLFHFS